MSKHSALGPSGAHRWLECPGSVNAEAIIRRANPSSDTSSVYAAEGTRAHDLAERLLLNPDLPEPGDEIDTMDDVDMLRHCLRYRDYCLNLSPGDEYWVEQRVKMPRVHKDCYGTADFAVYCPEYRHLHIVDLKYGQGERVEVKWNPQALLYAEGTRQYLYSEHRIKPKYFTVHIFQPRAMHAENIASFQLTNTQLDDWVSNAHVKALETQIDTETFNPGDKQCRWCLAAPCKARAAQMDAVFADYFDDLDEDIEDVTSALKRHDFEISDEDLSQWLQKIGTVKSFVAQLEALAYSRAMDRTKIPGFKLVEGRGSYHADVEALEFILGDRVYKNPEIRSKTDLQKELGSRLFNKLVKPCYKRSPGKPTLVAESDPRRPWDANADAVAMLDDL